MYPKRSAIIQAGLFILVLIFASTSRAGSDVNMIDTARLHSFMMDNAYDREAGRKERVTIIDARSSEEYDQAHIFSAYSVPEKDFEKATNVLPKDKGAFIIVYDNDIKSGTGVRWAGRAASAGYTNVAVYSEGFPVWKQKENPVVVQREPLKIR